MSADVIALRDRDMLRLRPAGSPEPFRSTEAAWFWCMEMLLARRDGAGARFGSQRRICDPDDIVKALDRLYRQRKVTLEHARILRIYGERGKAPVEGYPPERREARTWHEAIRALDTPLRQRGIVGTPAPVRASDPDGLDALDRHDAPVRGIYGGRA